MADDAASAVDVDSGTVSSTSCTSTGRDRHRFFNYGIALPAGATVQGIEVRLDSRVDSTSGSPRMCVELSWDGGVHWTAPLATSTLSTTMATRMLGSATSAWGRTWTPAELSNANFRVRVTDVANSTTRDFSLDWVAVRVLVQKHRNLIFRFKVDALEGRSPVLATVPSRLTGAVVGVVIQAASDVHSSRLKVCRAPL